MVHATVCKFIAYIMQKRNIQIFVCNFCAIFEQFWADFPCRCIGAEVAEVLWPFAYTPYSGTSYDTSSDTSYDTPYDTSCDTLLCSLLMISL